MLDRDDPLNPSSLSEQTHKLSSTPDPDSAALYPEGRPWSRSGRQFVHLMRRSLEARSCHDSAPTSRSPAQLKRVRVNIARLASSLAISVPPWVNDAEVRFDRADFTGRQVQLPMAGRSLDADVAGTKNVPNLPVTDSDLFG